MEHNTAVTNLTEAPSTRAVVVLSRTEATPVGFAVRRRARVTLGRKVETAVFNGLRGERSLRVSVGVSLAVATAIAYCSLGAQLARAVTNSSPANPSEAPWMVKIFLRFADGSARTCSGEFIAHGVVLTAGHCVYQSDCPGSAFPAYVFMRFSNAQGLRLTDPSTRVTPEPQYNCGTNTNTGQDDLAVLRVHEHWGLPAIPIASSAEIASMANQGITAFGGGQFRRDASGWYSSSWVRKSPDGGLFLNPYCQVPGYLCFRYHGSSVRPGDSGGALVGWLGQWKLLAVLDNAFQLSSGNIHMGAGASMADPGARAWVDQQAASPFS